MKKGIVLFLQILFITSSVSNSLLPAGNFFSKSVSAIWKVVTRATLSNSDKLLLVQCGQAVVVVACSGGAGATIIHWFKKAKMPKSPLLECYQTPRQEEILLLHDNHQSESLSIREKESDQLDENPLLRRLSAVILKPVVQQNRVSNQENDTLKQKNTLIRQFETNIVQSAKYLKREEKFSDDESTWEEEPDSPILSDTNAPQSKPLCDGNSSTEKIDKKYVRFSIKKKGNLIRKLAKRFGDDTGYYFEE